MAGKKGQIHKNPKADTLRGKAWRSMRIMKSFTIQVLLTTCTAEEISKKEYDNLKKWVTQLQRHGYIRKIGQPDLRWAGVYQSYILVKNSPSRPLSCDTCGQSLSVKICDPSLLKKETKKKRKKETETEKQEICGCEDLCHAHENKADEKVEVDHE